MRVTKVVTVAIQVEDVSRLDEIRDLLEIPTRPVGPVIRVFQLEWIQAPKPEITGYVKFAWEELADDLPPKVTLKDQWIAYMQSGPDAIPGELSSFMEKIAENLANHGIRVPEGS